MKARKKVKRNNRLPGISLKLLKRVEDFERQIKEKMLPGIAYGAGGIQVYRYK